MFFKTLPIKIENLEEKINIFNDDKTYIILKKLKNISFETIKDQNYTIYLQTKENIRDRTDALVQFLIDEAENPEQVENPQDLYLTNDEIALILQLHRRILDKDPKVNILTKVTPENLA